MIEIFMSFDEFTCPHKKYHVVLKDICVANPKYLSSDW